MSVGRWMDKEDVIHQSVQFSCSVVSDSLQPHGLHHARPPCPSPTPGAYSSSCPSSWWYHPTVSFSVIHFSSCLQSFPASESSLMSQFFTSGDQSIGASASVSVFPINIQDWFPLGLTGLISLQLKGLSSHVLISWLSKGLSSAMLCSTGYIEKEIFTDAESYIQVQFSSVAQSCATLCDPMNRSTPGLPVHHQLQEFTQTHVALASPQITPYH